MWEDFIEYNLIRTTFLKTFIENNLAGDNNLLLYFLQKYQESGSIFESWVYVKNLKSEVATVPLRSDIYERYTDYKENWWEDKNILKYLRELFPDMLSSGYDIRNLEKDVEKFSPLSIEEFYKITKGKYYLGQDLDEDLAKMLIYTKDQEAIEENLEDLVYYFSFRKKFYSSSILCEYYSIPFGIHESRALNYKKTGYLNFDYPREYYKYPVIELVEKYLTNKEVSGTRVLNIRGTNGSGKTTMVNNIYLDSLNNGSAEEKTMNLTDAKGKTYARFYDVLHDKNIVLLGGYNTPYGTKGCDRLGDVYEILQGILYLVSNYPGWTIIMESATVSTSFWAYALLFSILKTEYKVDINIVHLWMTDWEFCVNNVRNRTARKEGAKEPNYKEVVDKREILYKNHYRFSSILGKDSCMIMYPDKVGKEDLHILLNKVIVDYTGKELLWVE